METIVGVNGFDVECKEFLLLVSSDEGYGGVGTEDVPEDVAEEGKYSSECVKGKNEEEDGDHTMFLVFVGNPFLWP